MLEKIKVDAKDRAYQVWERNALSVDLLSRKVLEQKLDYIHNNPVQEKWQLCKQAEDYKYSSIRFYEQENTEWDFLKTYISEILKKSYCASLASALVGVPNAMTTRNTNKGAIYS